MTHHPDAVPPGHLESTSLTCLMMIEQQLTQQSTDVYQQATTKILFER
jgi:hypothetical protein